MTARSGRHAALVRVLSLLRLLETGHEWTLLSLADRFSVSTRTVRRDFAALAAAGYLLERRLDAHRGWSAAGRYSTAHGRWRLAKKGAA